MKKTNLRTIKLSLRPETIRSLSSQDMQNALGGFQATIGGGNCQSEENQCQTARAGAQC